MLLDRTLCRQQFYRNAKPSRGFFPLLKYVDVDRRTLSEYGKQSRVMNNSGIGRENRGLDWRTTRAH
jgi:hypothetical protein